ncbi:hypothetical protein SCP_0700170 [Sparassis crispa]|uniref:Uncharacterized protein n=1 Tax=Sparassis crispa TaxID=139825 RepID=A0A401GRI3_9APHY|nr:hypothetical protein SCP_0700170 [Sparassis crispa]GBE84837.1 hypothetical protein SCP_0700170 [Sparassis crispa]
MDLDFDTTWCPVCSRQIVPKRIHVPIQPPQPPPLPSSPTSEPKMQDADTNVRLTRNKTGTIRAKGGGLVHGTGRVKPNGTIRRSDRDAAKKPPSPTAAAPPAPAPAPTRTGPVRHRTIIDQSPIPLYCSDECRLADLQSNHGALDIDYHPDRCLSPTLPPVPHNSYSEFSLPDESDSASGGSLDSRSSIACSPPESVDNNPSPPAYPVPENYARLQAVYDLPPLPPPPPLLRAESTSSEASVSSNDYQSGVMMAARRIKAALCQPKQNLPSWSVPPPRKPIPGWTDGSNAWRASVYSFAAPSDTPVRIEDEDGPKAYKSFVASSHRSRGVFSTMSGSPDDYVKKPSSASLPAPPPPRTQSTAEELYAKYPMNFVRRTDSRGTMAHASASPNGSVRSLPASSSSVRRREFPLVMPGAEGRLLVPNVKMSRTASNLTVSSSSEAPSSYGSYGYPGVAARTMKRSPLSRQNSDASFDTADSQSAVDDEEETARRARASPSPVRKRQPPMRSWSYNADTLTYPILQLPKMEKRIEKRVVDGVEREVEVEVEVIQPLKRLFLFPGKDVPA